MCVEVGIIDVFIQLDNFRLNRQSVHYNPCTVSSITVSECSDQITGNIGGKALLIFSHYAGIQF